MMRPRGYALMFVIGITISLGIIVGGLFAFLAESVSSSKQTHEELQQLYGCDGALRLATFEAQRLGANVDIAILQQSLGTLATSLKNDLNPRTGRPYADLEGIAAVPESSQTFQATADPFFGMQFVQVGSQFIVEANPGLSRGRTCRGRSPNLSRTISYFQFAAVSNDILLSRSIDIGSIIEGTPGTTGSILTLQHSASSRGGLGRRRPVTSRGAFSVEDIHVADDETFRPVPPSGQPWSFVNKRRTGSVFRKTKRRTHHKRPSLEYFVKYPTHSPSLDPTQSRFAIQADIRIIDGEWFIADAFGNYPGTKVWSDRPGARDATSDFTYSAYETELGLARGGAAIVRYGLVGRHAGALVPHAVGVCLSEPGRVAPVVASSSGPIQVVCTLGPENPPPGIDPLLVASQTGFLDPYRASDGAQTPILPIVFDVRAFAAAMLTTRTGDLGAARCLHDNTTLCPLQRRFRGAVWIGTLPAGIDVNGVPLAPGASPAGELPTTAVARRPCPLEAPGAAGCARPNAVVIVNADNLEPFAQTGLSIGSNLPIYVVGNVNTGPGPITARVALLAPSITGLSADFDMTDVAWSNGSSVVAAPTTATLTWKASIFTSWASARLDRRDPSLHVLRRIQNGLHINVDGSMVTMFRRQDYGSVQVFHPGPGSYSSPFPDVFVTGIPTFVPSDDNPEEEEQRLAGGILRFPGDAGRNLRRANIDHQPPAAPRFSIDPAPIDRR
jgi:hypothetical protein